jgi:transcriptional regulator with XRE-family HTH domain
LPPLIRTARQRAGLTQHELAIIVGAGSRAIWQLEQGTGTLKTLLPVLRVLRIAISGLPPAPDLGSRIKAARLKRGWSLQELSTRCGISVPTLQGLERNVGRVTSLEAVIRALAPNARERRRDRPRREASQRPVPFEAANLSLFVNADCRDAMPAMASGSVNLVVTSPPYGAKKLFEDDLSLEDYTHFAEAWVSCIPRLLTANGALWLNLGYIKLSPTQALPLTYPRSVAAPGCRSGSARPRSRPGTRGMGHPASG